MIDYSKLIKALRNCADYSDCGICKLNGKFNCADMMMRDAAAALEAADETIADCTAAIDALDDSNDAYIKENERLKKRIAELEDDLRNSTISNPDRFKIYGYRLRDLILFADMCKRNDVQESDLKQAAWNLELAARAYYNATIENFRTWEDEKGIHASMRYVPNFEKAYAEMMGKEQTRC